MCFNRDWNSTSSDISQYRPSSNHAKDDNTKMRREQFVDNMFDFEVEEPPAFVYSNEEYVFPKPVKCKGKWFL